MLMSMEEIINSICERKGALQLNGLLDMQKPHITYSIFKELARPTLFIANSDLEAKKVYRVAQNNIKTGAGNEGGLG